MSSPEAAPAPELEQELDLFRREWLAEAERKRQEQRAIPAAAVEPLASGSASSPPRAGPARTITAGLEQISLSEDPNPRKARSAVDEYALAVEAEREGRLNEGELAVHREGGGG